MTFSSALSSVNDKQLRFFQLVSLALPIMLSLCITSLVSFSDRTFLARSSIEDLGGYVSGFILAALFQTPLIRITTLGQSFVGFYNNTNERHCIGEAVWQMIWFSLLSMVITLPVGYIIMPFVFGGSSVQETATSYFTCLLWGNFLFPLQASLSSFFIGQNKAKIVFVTVLGAQCIHVLLDYFLIFGIENYLPALGVFGAAVALISNRVIVCTALFMFFLRKKNRLVYGTNRYHFNWNVFYDQIRPGIPLSIAPFIGMSCWVAVNRLMAMKGGDYLLVFSVGSSLTVCFAFINDALFQAVMTSVSSLLGRGCFASIKKLVVQAFFLLSLIMLLLAVPFFIYPKILLSFLFPSLPSGDSLNVLFSTCYSSWVFIACEGALYIGMGVLAATRQTLYFIFVGILIWVVGYVPVFITMSLWNWQATAFWPIVAASVVIASVCYFFKTRQLITRYKQELLG